MNPHFKLFTGVFEQLAGPMAALTTIVTAPEFKAGLESWSATLGSMTGAGLETAAGAMERIDAAITPLLNAGAPPWLVAYSSRSHWRGAHEALGCDLGSLYLQRAEGVWRFGSDDCLRVTRQREDPSVIHELSCCVPELGRCLRGGAGSAGLVL
jgi:hypothetical protein